MIPVKWRVHQMQKNWIKIVTVHGHYSCPLSYKLDRFNHYMRHTKNITSYHCFK